MCPMRQNSTLHIARQWPDIPQSISSRGESGPHLIQGSLGPLESPPTAASRAVQPFCAACPCAQHTERHKNHASSDICSNSSHLHVCDATPSRAIGWSTPDPTWKRPPGRPRTKWTDQLRRDNNNVPIATLWRQAIGRGHSRATLRSEPTTR